jgi:hypothetical protein
MNRISIIGLLLSIGAIACPSTLDLQKQTHLNFAITDAALFEEIDTILLLPFPPSSPETCDVLVQEDVTYSHLMETISELPFIALPKLHTDIDIEGGHPEGIEGPYFRYVFGDLPNGELSLMTLGSNVALTEEEKELGFLSATTDQSQSFLGRFPYDSIVARSCIVTPVVEGVPERIEILLVPYSYGDSPAQSLDAGM